MSRLFSSPSVLSQIVSFTCGRTILWSGSGARGAGCSIRTFHQGTSICCKKPQQSNQLTLAARCSSSLGLSSNFHTSCTSYSAEEEEEEQRRQTETPRQNEDERKKESDVIERIRRLSMTSADEYVPSPLAQKKVEQLDREREEIIRKGEQWRWEQRNVKPGGFPQQPYQRNRDWGDRDYDESRYGRQRTRDWNDEEDEERYERPSGRGYDRYSYGGNRNWNRDPDEGYGGRSSRFVAERSKYGGVNERSSWRGNEGHRRQPYVRDDDDDEPQDYEVEMQKLRERLNQTKRGEAKAAKGEGNMATGDAVSEKPKAENTNLSNHWHETSYENPWHESSSRPESNSQFAHQSNYMHDQEQEQYYPEDKIDLSFAATDPDTFGNLTLGSAIVKDLVGAQIQKELNEEAKSAFSINEEEEEDDSRFVAPPGVRWTSHKLIKKVRELLKEKKLKEAVDTYLGALTEGGFQFDDNAFRHHFNVLINECANVGYVEMAFRLFNLMKKRGYKEGLRTISSLFNACANSPWDKERNLDRIERLLINMQDRGLEPNIVNYCALIKAYGRLGEITLAFSVVDTMIQEAKIRPSTVVFNMLLQACITDTKNGFRHALITWRKMQSMRIRPDIFSYNLLLRSIRDCGIEIPESEHLIKGMDRLSLPQLPPVITEDDSNTVLTLLCDESSYEKNSELSLDNLGDTYVVSTKSMMKALCLPENRLAVLGGLRGILSQMVRNKVGPNMKTLTELVQVTYCTEIYDILQLLRTYKIKPDVTFFNIAIKNCCDQRNDGLAKEMLKQMHQNNLTPNIMTWGVLSLGCRTWIDAKSLLEEMKQSNYTPNDRIMASLLVAAFKNHDPKYALHVMEEYRKREIPLDKITLMNLEMFYKNTQAALVKKEMGKSVEPPGLMEAMENNKRFADDFALFKMRYPVWLKLVEIKVLPDNPWKEAFQTFRTHKRHNPSATDEPHEDFDSLLSKKASE